MRVFDTFLFCDELDLLEVRLLELHDHVDRFVLVESPLTFQGNPKPLYYADNKERFAAYADKIIHVIADLNSLGEGMAREHAQRNATWQGLGEYEPGDIILHGDADEILRARSWENAQDKKLVLRCHPVAVNLKDPDQPWYGGCVPYRGNGRPEIVHLREASNSARPGLFDSGWHFSWLGGYEAMRAKVRMFSHPDQIPLIDRRDYYADKVNPVTGHTLDMVSIDSTYPEFIKQNRGPGNWYWS